MLRNKRTQRREIWHLPLNQGLGLLTVDEIAIERESLQNQNTE